VDDGIAIGYTIIAAAHWVKEGKHHCKKLIVAIPVAPSEWIFYYVKSIC